MSTPQTYGVVADSTTTIRQGVTLVTYRAQINAQIRALAERSGCKLSTTYSRVYFLVKAFYGIDVYRYRQRKRDSLLRVAEQFDLLDKVAHVVEHEQLVASL